MLIFLDLLLRQPSSLIGATAAGLVGSPRFISILISAWYSCVFTNYVFSKVNDSAESVKKILKISFDLNSTYECWSFLLNQFFMIDSFEISGLLVIKNAVLISTMSGLWGGLLIGLVTEYYTYLMLGKTSC